MNHGFVNRNRIAASSVVLAVLVVMSAVQAPAVQPKGELKPKEVLALVASAKTPADHMKLAHHYTAMAAKYESDAQEHEALAVEYAKSPALGESKHPMGPKSAEHCKFFAEYSHKAAKEMTEMAAEHEAMAKSLTK